ncbi:hypothetical protein Thal_1598 [Thermocrinis albus DSM 14484]|uniref:Uncharacterized protein n=1 Tax=Thermocrinis albus (strain DSM 14484 / JCM 11386 / HI 11/12) TaxID=638303 RepID=D3SN96_THEAH|nr:hypothetical protein [Thermocrinis albus]ADC90226.1 hypothetical protein Thal_1598 [Thermocrinis albus DSM 14484]
MDYVKMKASEYATLTGLSLNTVKNRIRAGVLKGEKAEDGLWYVYVPGDEYQHLLKREEDVKEVQERIKESMEKLRSHLEGNLIATYMELLLQKEKQKDELLHELASLYALLAIREKEIEILNESIQRMKKELSELEDLRKSLREKEKELAKLERDLKSAELECQKKLLEKEKELMEKETQLKLLRGEIDR